MHVKMNQFISAITLRIMVGLVLAAAIIISLLSLSQDLHLYLGTFQNGTLLQFVTFGLTLVASSLGLFWLVMKREIEIDSEQKDTSVTSLLSCDLKAIGVKFVEGFINGLAKEDRKVKIR
jgi:hypothetical protein